MIRINIIKSQIVPGLRVKPGIRSKLSYLINGLYLHRAAQRILPPELQAKSVDRMALAFKSGKIPMTHLLSLAPETAEKVIKRLTDEEITKTLEDGTERIREIKEEMLSNLRAEFEKSDDHLIKEMPFSYFLTNVFPYTLTKPVTRYSQIIWNKRFTLLITEANEHLYTAILNGKKPEDRVYTYGMLNSLIYYSLGQDRERKVIPFDPTYFVCNPMGFESNEDFLIRFLVN
jgi:hypothetical protein